MQKISTTFFTEIGSKLANKIEILTKLLRLPKKVDILQAKYPFSINELKEAIFSLQTNKKSSLWWS